jgi:hypothetical protein
MSQFSLAHDEFVTVFLGKGQDELSEFAQHPRVQWIRAGNGTSPVDVIKNVPQRTRAFIFTDGIPAGTYHDLSSEGKRRQVACMTRRNSRAVLGTLYEFFPPTNGAKVPIQQGTGFIQKLLDRHPPDPALSTADAARALHKIAIEEGIVTTIGSLNQAISHRRRKLQQSGVPASLRPTADPTDTVISQFDDVIASLQLMREWVAGTAGRIAELEKRFDTLKAALGV